MQEVTIRLRFTRESLGAARKKTKREQVIFAMLRDRDSHVMFLPTWWRGLMTYAARVVNRYQSLVDRITWDPRIDGRVVNINRTVLRWRQDGSVKSKGYALHEGFKAGDTIGVNAVLPDGMSIEGFSRLLATVGRYKGVSPFQDDDPYGLFEIVSVKAAIHGADTEPSESEPEVMDGSVGEALRNAH